MKRLTMTMEMGCLICVAISLVIIGPALMGASWGEEAVAAGPVKAGLPADLFTASAPPNALDVGDARKSAVEGKPVVLRGQVGGLPKPFAEKYAMFVVCDKRLAVCPTGCANPADFCSVPRDQLMANLATIQVADQKGVPLKVSLQGLNGLKPMSEVVIHGTVAKTDNNILIVNAHNIYVNNKVPTNP